MKKYFFLASITASVFVLTNCHSTKKAATEPVVAKATYQTDVQNLVLNNCSPCHIHAKGGRVKPLDTYDALKANIDEVIHRIQLNPGDKGFMPFKRAKLSDSTINVFKKWRDDGLLN
ncbi:MAG: hypothetical protein C4308_02985 [Chitinophagaceae bacterium]